MLLKMKACPLIWSRIAHSTSQTLPTAPSAGPLPRISQDYQERIRSLCFGTAKLTPTLPLGQVEARRASGVEPKFSFKPLRIYTSSPFIKPLGISHERTES